ncbi:tetratricopeptide repeat protein [bacterium]|nr:MAG: tetratricopeptide repeat protein [bacterium]
MNFIESKRLPLLMGLALLLAVGFLYAPVSGFDFIKLDDHEYVTMNDMVKGGLTPEGVKDALTKVQQFYWMPLTWLSLMTDAEIYGANAGGFHRTNAILHLLNVLLLFSFLYRATGSPWKSFLAAGLWALHPLRVESVAWVSERKDVLSAFFFLLALLAYLEYVRKTSAKWYLAALAAMFAGLASKQIVVITPVILLILDLWPLGRFDGEPRPEKLKKLVLEKLPFFALSALFSITALVLTAGNRAESDFLPPERSVLIIPTTYLHYLKIIFWPANLIIEDGATTGWLEWFPALLTFMLLAAATWFAFRMLKAVPAVTAGWLWFLAGVFPVSGVVMLGMNTVADHLTYYPAIGMSILLVWGIDAFIVERETARKVAAVAGLLCLAALGVMSGRQLTHWKDGITLFEYNVRTKATHFAERLLADAYYDEKRYPEAIELYKSSLQKNPFSYKALRNLGILLADTGKTGEAIAALEQSINIYSEDAQAWFNLGAVQKKIGNPDKALVCYRRASQIDPDFWEALFNSALLLAASGDFEGARADMSRAENIEPQNPEIKRELGIILARSGREKEAMDLFRRALELDPLSAQNNFNYAVALYKSGQLDQAAPFFKRAAEMEPNNPKTLFAYAKLLEESGKREEANVRYKALLVLLPFSEETKEAVKRTSGKN